MKAFFLGLFFVSIVHNALSLKCYNCIAESCKENPKPNPKECAIIPDIPSTSYTCIKVIANDVVLVRSCGTTTEPDSAKCYPETDEGITRTICFCKTDLCNNAQVSPVNKIMMFSVVLVAVFTQKFM